MKRNSSKHRQLWMSALVLFICVAATTIAVVERLNEYVPDDSGAIPLFANAALEAPVIESTPVAKENIQANTFETTTVPKYVEVYRNLQQSGTRSTYLFELSDEKGIWGTNTQIDIFKVSYENGQQVITVESGDGEKVIAPGTENSYIFKLTNNSSHAADYTVSVEAYFTPDGINIPITARLSRYDGKWIKGDAENYVDIPTFDGAYDEDKLGGGKYTYYTLDWLWPYESGNDELDTLLGNRAVDEDLTLTIIINTYAEVIIDHGGEDVAGGLTPPKTGDNTIIVLWAALLAASAALIVFLIIGKKKDRDNDY